MLEYNINRRNELEQAFFRSVVEERFLPKKKSSDGATYKNSEKMQSMSVMDIIDDGLTKSGADYEQELQELEEQKSDNETEVGEKEQNIESTESSIDDVNGKISDLEGQLSSLAPNYPSASAFYTKTNSETGEPELDSAAYEAARREAETEYNNKKAQLEQELSAAKAELSRLEGDLSIEKSELSSLQSEGSEIDAKISETEAEMNAAKMSETEQNNKEEQTQNTENEETDDSETDDGITGQAESSETIKQEINSLDKKIQTEAKEEQESLITNTENMLNGLLSKMLTPSLASGDDEALNSATEKSDAIENIDNQNKQLYNLMKAIDNGIEDGLNSDELSQQIQRQIAKNLSMISPIKNIDTSDYPDNQSYKADEYDVSADKESGISSDELISDTYNGTAQRKQQYGMENDSDSSYTPDTIGKAAASKTLMETYGSVPSKNETDKSMEDKGTYSADRGNDIALSKIDDIEKISLSTIEALKAQVDKLKEHGVSDAEIDEYLSDIATEIDSAEDSEEAEEKAKMVIDAIDISITQEEKGLGSGKSITDNARQHYDNLKNISKEGREGYAKASETYTIEELTELVSNPKTRDNFVYIGQMAELGLSASDVMVIFQDPNAVENIELVVELARMGVSTNDILRMCNVPNAAENMSNIIQMMKVGLSINDVISILNNPSCNGHLSYIASMASKMNLSEIMMIMNNPNCRKDMAGVLTLVKQGKTATEITALYSNPNCLTHLKESVQLMSMGLTSDEINELLNNPSCSNNLSVVENLYTMNFSTKNIIKLMNNKSVKKDRYNNNYTNKTENEDRYNNKNKIEKEDEKNNQEQLYNTILTEKTSNNISATEINAVLNGREAYNTDISGNRISKTMLRYRRYIGM